MDKKIHCHFAWQITGMCNHHCRYCLRQRTDRPVTEYQAADCRKVLDSFLDFIRTNEMEASVEFSGGNPLLRPDLPDLMRRIRGAEEDGLVSGITFLANPETLNREKILFLKECRTTRFSISLDGSRESTDAMRGAGAYDAAIRVIPMLVEAGIKVFVKYTITKLNYREAGETLNLVLNLGADSIGFGNLVQANAAPDISDLQLTPQEYREYLLGLLRHRDAMKPEYRLHAEHAIRQGNGTAALLFYELGRLEEFREFLAKNSEGMPGFPFAPEHRDRLLFVVWENGELHPCNAEPCVGHVPQESFQTIVDRVGQERFQFGRRIAARNEAPDGRRERPEFCRGCPVLEFCKHPSPHCWRKVQ